MAFTSLGMLKGVSWCARKTLRWLCVLVKTHFHDFVGGSPLAHVLCVYQQVSQQQRSRSIYSEVITIFCLYQNQAKHSYSDNISRSPILYDFCKDSLQLLGFSHLHQFICILSQQPWWHLSDFFFAMRYFQSRLHFFVRFCEAI